MSDTINDTEQLVDASRRITASRSTSEIVSLATQALEDLTGATLVGFVSAAVPLTSDVPGAVLREVHGHGRLLGTFELVFAPETDQPPSETITERLGLIATVTGAALATADDRPCAEAAGGQEGPCAGDRRRMDRDFIDHTRSGQVGYIVLRVMAPGMAAADFETAVLEAAAAIDDVVRENDVTYLSGPGELSVLLPGASKPDAAMAADRIRRRLEDNWLGGTAETSHDAPTIRLAGGVTAGSHEDPQRLAERALDALDEALRLGPNAIVTDLGA